MTIKEVECYLEIPRATVRFYEKEGLINPRREENGYREYSSEDVIRLKQIIVFRKLGMSVADIEDVLDGAKTLSEVVADNILNLENQIEELKGALFVCHKLQENKEEMATFEVDKYWDVIAEEEKKGNRFLDIAKDMVHFEKSIVLDYFGIADAEGNLSVGVGSAIGKIVIMAFLFGAVTCLIDGSWTWDNILDGIQNMLWMILLQVVVAIPVFVAGIKRPEILKNKNKYMCFILLAIFVLCILAVVCGNIFAR